MCATQVHLSLLSFLSLRSNFKMLNMQVYSVQDIIICKNKKGDNSLWSIMKVNNNIIIFYDTDCLGYNYVYIERYRCVYLDMQRIYIYIDSVSIPWAWEYIVKRLIRTSIGCTLLICK